MWFIGLAALNVVLFCIYAAKAEWVLAGMWLMCAIINGGIGVKGTGAEGR
jgi:hypothetical protein